MFSVKRTERLVHVAGFNRLFNLINPKSIGREFVRVNLNANGIRLRAKNADLRDAIDLRNLLRQQILGIIVHVRHRQCRRRHGQENNRRIRRIYFLISRRRRHIRRQLFRRLGDGRLYILCRRVNVAVERELNRD
jgi:hypothetical protein